MVTERNVVLPAEEAARRITADTRLLVDRVSVHADDDLASPYLVRGGPIGDCCESLGDLVAHVLMWNEVSLAVLAEAHRGRAHWSLDPRWEDPAVGRRLNAAGVAAGRELPVHLLVDRVTAARDALLDELSRYADGQWLAPISLSQVPARSIGELAQYAMTVPGRGPYWHAAIHLGEVGAGA